MKRFSLLVAIRGQIPVGDSVQAFRHKVKSKKLLV
jgi:hypothetical protein